LSIHETQQPLWRPSEDEAEQVEMARFMRWAGERRGRQFAGYLELWQWSVD